MLAHETLKLASKMNLEAAIDVVVLFRFIRQLKLYLAVQNRAVRHALKLDAAEKIVDTKVDMALRLDL